MRRRAGITGSLRKTLYAAGVGALAVGSLVVTAVPSSAAALNGVAMCYNINFELGTCPNLFDRDSIRDLGSVGLDNSISSVSNYSNHRVCFWENKDFTGKGLWLDPNNYIQDLRTVADGYFNDRISSVGPCS